jgi:hypothetical protein
MCAVPSSYLEIYTDNPDVCKLVILKTDDGQKIKGRAILWKLSNPENLMYMDRIYTHLDSDIELFRQYCKFRKWNYKLQNQSTEDTKFVTPEGTTEEPEELTVFVNKGGYDKYPYLDTLKYFKPSTGQLTTDNSNYGRNSGWYDLEDTGGGHADSEECEHCSGEGRVDCPECDGSGSFDCNECNGSGEIDCNDCDGTGHRECPDCDGSGKVDDKECSNCDGSGEIDCDTCDGDGTKRCTDCDGDGNNDCDFCNGNGRVDCPECQ